MAKHRHFWFFLVNLKRKKTPTQNKSSLTVLYMQRPPCARLPEGRPALADARRRAPGAAPRLKGEGKRTCEEGRVCSMPPIFRAPFSSLSSPSPASVLTQRQGYLSSLIQWGKIRAKERKEGRENRV